MKGNPPAEQAPDSPGPTGDAFALNPFLDAEALRDEYAREGRIHIADFLAAESARALHACLKSHEGWRLVINQDEKVFELDRVAQAELSPERRQQLDLAVYKGARAGFQYRFETIRIPDSAAERKAMPNVMVDFADFLSSPATLEFLKHVTGDKDIRFADAQATAYSPGHFLTTHDDDVSGKARRAAYVMNLTPAWSVDWGGLLMFQGGDGHVERAFVPTFNALNLFRVPAPHAVSVVAPFAAFRRYSVTGWLRAISPPA